MLIPLALPELPPQVASAVVEALQARRDADAAGVGTLAVQEAVRIDSAHAELLFGVDGAAAPQPIAADGEDRIHRVMNMLLEVDGDGDAARGNRTKRCRPFTSSLG